MLVADGPRDDVQLLVGRDASLAGGVRHGDGTASPSRPVLERRERLARQLAMADEFVDLLAREVPGP